MGGLLSAVYAGRKNILRAANTYCTNCIHFRIIFVSFSYYFRIISVLLSYLYMFSSHCGTYRVRKKSLPLRYLSQSAANKFSFLSQWEGCEISRDSHVTAARDQRVYLIIVNQHWLILIGKQGWENEFCSDPAENDTQKRVNEDLCRVQFSARSDKLSKI